MGERLRVLVRKQETGEDLPGSLAFFFFFFWVAGRPETPARKLLAQGLRELVGSVSGSRTTNCGLPVHLFPLCFAACKECGLTQNFSLGSSLSIFSWGSFAVERKEGKGQIIWT